MQPLTRKEDRVFTFKVLSRQLSHVSASGCGLAPPPPPPSLSASKLRLGCLWLHGVASQGQDVGLTDKSSRNLGIERHGLRVVMMALVHQRALWLGALLRGGLSSVNQNAF